MPSVTAALMMTGSEQNGLDATFGSESRGNGRLGRAATSMQGNTDGCRHDPTPSSRRGAAPGCFQVRRPSVKVEPVRRIVAGREQGEVEPVIRRDHVRLDRTKPGDPDCHASATRDDVLRRDHVVSRVGEPARAEADRLCVGRHRPVMATTPARSFGLSATWSTPPPRRRE